MVGQILQTCDMFAASRSVRWNYMKMTRWHVFLKQPFWRKLAQEYTELSGVNLSSLLVAGNVSVALIVSILMLVYLGNEAKFLVNLFCFQKSDASLSPAGGECSCRLLSYRTKAALLVVGFWKQINFLSIGRSRYQCRMKAVWYCLASEPNHPRSDTDSFWTGNAHCWLL